MTKDDLNDVKRYREHLKDLYRAKEILNSNESKPIKHLLLEEIGCDKITFGEWEIYDNGKERFRTINTKMSHIWAIDREIRSFEHAIKLMENEPL